MKKLLQLPILYNNLCERKPISTITISTGIILGAGDIMTQYLEQYWENKQQQKYIDSSDNSNQNSSSKQILKKEYKIDTKRALCMAAYGVSFLGPANFIWYCKVLPRLVPVVTNSQITNKQIFKKICWDQTIYAWIFYSSFLYLMTIFEGGSSRQGVDKIKKDFWTIYKVDLMFWPYVQYFNFKFVPYHMQTIVVSFTSIFWGAFLSYVQHK